MNANDLNRPAAETIHIITKLGRVCAANKITQDEYFGAILRDLIVTERSSWRNCVATLAPTLRLQFATFARSFLVSNDFMPSPGIVDPRNNTAEKVEAAKRFFRPRYVDLLKVIEELSGGPGEETVVAEKGSERF